MNTDFIRKRITELRMAKNISEYKLSRDLGKSKTYIQSITNGISLPSVDMLLEICIYFNVSPSDFFDEKRSLSHSPILNEILNKIGQLPESEQMNILDIVDKYMFYFEKNKK